MELLTFIVTIIAILALVDAGAIRKGVDSRDSIGDDWTRRTFDRSDLLSEVWGIQGEVQTRTVDTHIRRLRERLGTHGDAVETVYGTGYRLKADA